jgi:hypothetical protein
MGKFSNVKLYVVGLALVLAQATVYGQSKGTMVEDAQALFDAKDYKRAYDAYDKLNAKYPKDLDFKFKLGLCCLNFTEKKARAVEVFEGIKIEVKSPDAAFYLGKAYHMNYKFDKSITELEEFKNTNKNTSKEGQAMITEADKLIRNCKAAKTLIEGKITADFQNLNSVNTDEDEYGPAITTDEGVMVFTYKGKKSVGGKVNIQLQPDEAEGEYHEDVYVTVMGPDSTWGTPQSVAEINTNGHDAAISISPDGRYIFMFQSSETNNGDIYMSVLTGTTFSKPEPLNENINSQAWEGSCSISSDGQILYFSSERPGGKGGRDIWASVKINGDWGPAINLGSAINTEFDDDAPFIHPDGITLFFSSKGHNSIGGYDIMFSIMKEDQWTEPKSMGMPLNTTEDDLYYVINSRGDKGYFSSNRPAGEGGKGGEDIYTVSPGILGDKPVCAVLKGVVYGNDKPVEAVIEVTKNKDGKLVGPFYSNNVTGKYLFAISPGSSYRIKVTSEGFAPIVEDVDITTLDKFMEVKKDFYLYYPKNDTAKAVVTTTTVPPTNTVVVKLTNETPTVAATPTVAVSNEPCSASNLPDLSPIKGKSLNDPSVYQQMLQLAGEYCASGMVFKVQIGAYRKPQNFKYKNLKEFGTAEVSDYPDGITRFTQQQFTTVNKAEALRQKVIAKGQKDAWIVAFVNGKRYTLEELINLDFLGKSIN